MATKWSRMYAFFSHLFLFVRLFTYLDLDSGVNPLDYLQCIKRVTKESPRVPNSVSCDRVHHWENAIGAKGVLLAQLESNTRNRIYFSVVLMSIVTVDNHFLLSSYSLLVGCLCASWDWEHGTTTHFDKLNLINFIFTTTACCFFKYCVRLLRAVFTAIDVIRDRAAWVLLRVRMFTR